MSKAGLTPLDALQAATILPARFVGVCDTQGSIGAGKLADVVLLSADPLANIENARRIDAVVVNGRLIRRAELDRLLAAAESAAR